MYAVSNLRYPKQFQERVLKDGIAHSISLWSSRETTLKLNRWQEEAMTKALNPPFQLIQGPTGTHLLSTSFVCSYTAVILLYPV